eukprot:25643_1
MISKSQKRRQRKSKQNKVKKANCMASGGYMNKFKIIENYRKMTDIVISGYLHEIIKSYSNLPLEIERLCRLFCNDEKMIIQTINELPRDTTKLISKDRQPQSILKFGKTFNFLYYYEKMVFCRRIIQQQTKELPIHELRVYPDDSAQRDGNIDTTALSRQLYFIEYILCKQYNTISKLDLSEMQMNDRHVLYLCNAIENMIQYRKHMKVEHAKTKQNKPNKQKRYDPQTLKYFGNKKVQKEVQKQFERMQEVKRASVKDMNVKMKLEEVDLSMNNISDKYFDLLLRTIKRHAPQMKRLLLSSNNISNKSLANIMKYGIRGLVIDLSSCKGVTLRGLNKYPRTDYDEETPQRYVYCENMVYFVNEKEEQLQDDSKYKKGKRVRGKGKKFRSNKKRALYDGPDAQETGLPPWW